MANKSGKTEVVLRKETNTVVLRDGIRVEFNGKAIDIYGDVPVKLHLPRTGHTAANANTEHQHRTNPTIGRRIPGKGVFLGTWAPKDRNGKSLNTTFNLFAAPHDLGLDENGRGTKLAATYYEAVAAARKITNLMGHAGFKGKTDTDLYKALRNGSYKGEWFMPTKDVLNGRDRDGNEVQNDHLFGNRNTGALEGTFTTVDSSVAAHWYWACTEHRDDASYVCDVRFTDGDDYWVLKDNLRQSSRLVRAEPVAP